MDTSVNFCSLVFGITHTQNQHGFTLNIFADTPSPNWNQVTSWNGTVFYILHPIQFNGTKVIYSARWERDIFLICKITQPYLTILQAMRMNNKKDKLGNHKNTPQTSILSIFQLFSP